MEASEVKDARSGTDSQNLQEILDAAVSGVHALQHGQNQYQTPSWLAKALAGLLPFNSCDGVYDPQCAGGNLLLSVNSHRRYGTDIDNRFKDDLPGNMQRITGNCVKIWETYLDVYATDDRMKFPVIVANPPFGIRWKINGDKDNTIDSTEWTWKLVTERLLIGGCGYFIASADTIERLKIDKHDWVYLYQRFPAGGIWDNCDVAIGVVHYQNNNVKPRSYSWEVEQIKVPHARKDHVWANVPNAWEISGLGAYLTFTDKQKQPPSANYFDYQWQEVAKIVREEQGSHSKWNIYLNKEGILRTYLSTRHSMKFNRDDVYALERINGCRPLTLTTERESRKMLHKFLTAGIYTIEPEARDAILSALAEVNGMACPIRPVTDFECVAYTEEEDDIECVAKDATGKVALTIGKRYEVKTGTYSFSEKYVTKKLYYDEDEETTELKEHDCELHGQDRYIEIIDDRKHIHRFMDRPNKTAVYEHHESMLWDLFKKPYVPTVKEVDPEKYAHCLEIMEMCEVVNGYKYFEGQREYYARMGCKDYGTIAAETGCHAKGALILMADGRSKPIEDILPGESVMGWDNTKRRVIQLRRGHSKMAKITPVKGESFVVNLDHVLTLVQTNTIRGKKLEKTNGAIIDITVREYLTKPVGWRHHYKLFRRGIELREQELLFSPYFMGVYLGDGSSAGDQVEISGIDIELRDATRAECRNHGWEYREHKYGDRCPGYVLKGGGPRSWLKVLGLLKATGEAKFIPERYKRNTRKVRLEVLAGLIDTDGSLGVGGYDYISQSKRLADDVVWLARSVGLAAYVKPCEKRDQHGNGGTYHRVSISGHTDMVPTRIPRKQAAPRRQKKDVLRTGFTVELLPTDDFYGFTIEGDGRYLMGDFTVTHNSGKTLGALTMQNLKSPKRTLIIAPQGTMRSSGDEDEQDYQASQWVQEIRKFAPTEPVFQLFSYADWQAVLHANGGELPAGIYISYPQAYFSNGAFESCPATWTDRNTEEKFCKEFDLEFQETRPNDELLSRNVGHEKNGIRCIAAPCLHTEIAQWHGHDVWDMVILDEAHLICNQEARISKNLLRVQPKYRFLMTATPIPNVVSNIFSLMGWACVPNWYKGDICNAAWPYTLKDKGRFENTFMSYEIDLTATAINKAKGKKSYKVIHKSPIISSPARLLKLLKPSMAHISKEDCNPDMQPCEVVDVRVKMGKQQAKLYEYWLNRANYKPEFKSALTIAMVQSSRLRGCCTAPASLEYTRGMCHSNFNPKTVTVLGLIRDCLRRGEQVTVVSARVDQSDEYAARLSEAKVPIARIDSTVTAEMHTAEANRFKRGDARVMLMGIKCAQGHSFERCPNLIVGSLEWSYGSLHQAKGRVHRLTSPKPVKVWVVLHQGTIEEVLFDRVALKQDAATICLKGRRIPRDYKPFDAKEVLAEHIVNFDADSTKAMSEVECEQQWPELRKQLALTNQPKKEKLAKEEAA